MRAFWEPACGQHGSRHDLRSLFRTESRSVNIFEPYSTMYVEKGRGYPEIFKTAKESARAKFFQSGLRIRLGVLMSVLWRLHVSRTVLLIVTFYFSRRIV